MCTTCTKSASATTRYISRHCSPSRDERKPFHSPARASSWNPLIALKPGGPESLATSFHFSYRTSISRGTAVDSCLSTRRCSSMRHMPYCAYTIYGMSRALASCGIRFNITRLARPVSADPALRRPARGRHPPAISRTLQTVLQLRSVIGTPRHFSEPAASFDLPTPSGACR